MSKVERFGCQEYGCYKRDCPKLKKDNNNKRKREEAHVTQEVKEDDKKQKKEDPPRTKSTSLLKVFFQRGGRGLIGGPIYGIQERMIYRREQMKQERLHQSRRSIK